MGYPNGTFFTPPFTEAVGERLYRTVTDIASGTLSRRETLACSEPTDFCLEEPRF